MLKMKMNYETSVLAILALVGVSLVLRQCGYSLVEGFSGGSGGLYSGSAVRQLGPNDFDGSGKAKCGRGIVTFYKESCIHCRRMSPALKEAAARIPRGFTVGCVDCAKYPELAEKYDISGFPTIFVIDAAGNMMKYSGSRTAEDFMNAAKGA
jgi:thiol-disulfide isomerase/thioredoxin